MKNKLFFTGLFLLSLIVNAATVNPVLIHVGDVAVIGAPSHFSYSAILFPHKNFIMKRGGVINYKTLVGVKVEIVDIEEKNNGSRVAIIKRADGRKFFNALPTVKIQLKKAVDNKELLLTTNNFSIH